ncbi:MAG: hypothetical protein K2X82_30195, partial [Gemmataceae bacterium]|nr:hypothetical protein [Gemmataceae bacterium]
PAEADAAVRGLGLLKFSLGLYLLSGVLSAGLSAARAAADGPRVLLTGEPGNSAGLIIATSAVGLVLGLVAAALRLVGYARCKPVGRAVGSDSLLTPASVGVVLQGIALVLVSAAGLHPAKPAEQHPVVTAAVMLGGFLSLAGVGLELCAAFWYRTVLTALAGPEAGRRVRTYLITLAVAAAVGFVAAFGFGMAAAFAAVAKNGPRAGGGPGARPKPFDFADVPDELLVGAGVGAAAAVAVGLVICWQYYRILVACQAAIAATVPTDDRPDDRI